MLLITGCGSDSNPPPQSVEPLPSVLIVGDSISIGYTPYVQQLVRSATVDRIPVNARDTGYGRANIEEWLSAEYDVIYFNWGLWDMARRNPLPDNPYNLDDSAPVMTELPEYKENLQVIIDAIRHLQPHATLVFATTTPVPEGAVGRFPSDPPKYNEAALEVMSDNSILISDLYSYVLPYHDSIQASPGDVHFSETGYEFIAYAVVDSIGNALRERSQDNSRTISH